MGKVSILRGAMRFVAWLSGFGVGLALLDKIAGALLNLHIATGW